MSCPHVTSGQPIFKSAPLLKHIHCYNNQLYVLSQINETHSGSALLIWSSFCTTCGAPFTTTSGLSSATLGRRCKSHRDGTRVRDIHPAAQGKATAKKHSREQLEKLWAECTNAGGITDRQLYNKKVAALNPLDSIEDML